MSREQKRKYNFIESSYLDAFLSINKSYDLIVFLADYSDETIENPGIFYYVNSQEFENICLNSLREKEIMKIFIPSIGVIIDGGYDLGNYIYIKHSLSSSEEFENFKNIFTEKGFYVFKENC